jgi:predicted DNA-binding transcriptional regulator YafY
MKIDRLLSIVFILLKNEKITAKELSEYFNVSARTIYRDLETLDNAGIPIISFQGKEGGYGIIDTFKINDSFLKKEEASTILNILKSLSDIFDEINIEKIMTLKDFENDNSKIGFDFSNWGEDSEFKDKINIINNALKNKKKIEFKYFSSSGAISFRIVSPYKLLLKASNWYLYGFCHLKNDERLFKVIRIENLILLNENSDFLESNNFDIEKIFFHRNPNLYSTVNLKLKFDNSAYFHAKELFSEKNIIEKNDNFFIVKTSYPEDDWVYSMILSFGEKVEVLSPDHIKEIILKKIEKMSLIYKKEI